MSDIFISYAREDVNAARRLAAVLEGLGWSVFWDRTIPAGKSWRAVIGAELTDARCVVVLWSQHSVTSDFVLEEADRGLRRRALIPALLESVDPPFGFGSIQAADLSTWDGNYEDAVIKQFFGDLAGTLGPAPVLPPGERSKAEVAAERKAREQEREQAEAEAIRRTLEDSERGPGTGFRDLEAPWCPELVVIPAGSFVMGSPDDEKGRDSDEEPLHRVRFAAEFALGRYPVTFEEYDRFCVETGREQPPDQGWGRGRRPVINVAWDDAQAYCAWLRRQTGQPYRLPSEAEWEYACRAGTTTPFWTGETISTEEANYDGGYAYGSGDVGEYREQTTPVDAFAMNPWGVHDLHGNVWEWCEDCWNDRYAGAPTDGAAWLQGECALRVVRGGSWYGEPRYLRAACRSKNARDDRGSNLGFRVARTLAP